MIPMLALSISVAFPSVSSAVAKAADPEKCTINLTGGKDCAKPSEVPKELFDGDNSIFKTVTNAALFLIGAISVLMLIYGGIRYTVSGGDTKQVTDAKNTILYAVVGIVVAIMAYAIVNFVIGRLVTTP